MRSLNSRTIDSKLRKGLHSERKETLTVSQLLETYNQEPKSGTPPELSPDTAEVRLANDVHVCRVVIKERVHR